MDRERDLIESRASARLPTRDEAAALAAVGGDADLAHELLLALLNGLPSEVAALATHLQGGDWAALAQTAHRLRGATAYCGVPALNTALQGLERAAKSGTPERVGALLGQVEQEAERLRATAGTR